MGKVAEAAQPQIHVRVSMPLLRRVAAESTRVNQAMAAWVRMAITEKLERDEP